MKLNLAAAAALLSLVSGSAFAQVNTATQSTAGAATIIQPISLAVASSLSFGTVVRPTAASGTVVIDNSGASRLFCPIRHEHSLSLPDLFREMCEKATHPVAATAEANWSIFRVQIASPMIKGEKYWVFFRVKPNSKLPDGTHLVDVYVESAYPRATPVVTFRRLPFGRLIAETALL